MGIELPVYTPARQQLAPLNIGQAADLVDLSIQRVFEKSSEPDINYDKYYNVRDTEDYFDKDSSLSGLGEADFVDENAIIVSDTPVQGYKKTYTQNMVGAINTTNMPRILNVPTEYRSKEWLYQKYVIEGLSAQKIAGIVGADRKTIDQWLEKQGITKRGVGGQRWKPLRADLKKLYLKEKKSINSIAKMVGEDRKTVHRRLTKFGILLRGRGDPRKGPESPWWTGGKYKNDTQKGYRYVWTDKLRREHLVIAEEVLGRPLVNGEVVHHINFDRGDNHVGNLYLFENQTEHMKYHHDFRRGLAGALKSNLKELSVIRPIEVEARKVPNSHLCK